VSLKENDYEQRRSQVRVLPSAPQKVLQNIGKQESPGGFGSSRAAVD
jgi:hypothetical protein